MRDAVMGLKRVIVRRGGGETGFDPAIVIRG
jgi:hypothetical protein